MDDSIHGPVITVHNTQTGEVVRQIPSQVVLNIAHSIDSLKGVLFSKKI
jgi:flagellar protein FlaG